MKKHIFILLQIFLLCISGKLISQSVPTGNTTNLTPGGFFDKVHDRFGNEYQLSNLNLNHIKPIGGTSTVQSLPTQSCISGYFHLFFAPGSFFDNNSAAQNLMCQLCSDISSFIASPLSTSTYSNVKVNLYCDNETSSALGTASCFFLYPVNASNPNQGIIEGVVQKFITTGVDPYSSIPVGPFTNPNSFYHAYIKANPSVNWNLNLSTINIGSNENDLYSVMLHEISHALGFVSLIGSNGLSQFGASDNYFTRYDQFLKDYSGNPLLSTSTPSCPNTNIVFTASITAISPSNCVSGMVDVTNCSIAATYSSSSVNNVKVFTPDCYVTGSSLSHFEDYCTWPSSFTTVCTPTPSSTYNNFYFTMSNAVSTGSCYIKRYLKEEERHVLCDIGYTVQPTYSSTSSAIIDGTSSSHGYTAGLCSGSNIWGLNDVLVNGIYTFTAIASSATNSISIPITSITVNDSPATTSISCLDVIYGNATYSISGSNLIVTANTNVTGLVLIKYLPKNSSGQYGGPTYIYCYFIPGSCNPPDACDMIQNGQFENTNSSGLGCGPIGTQSNSASLSCWDNHLGNVDLFTRSCAQSGGQYNLGTNTYNSTPPINSFNGSPNNGIIGLGVNTFGSEVLKNNLSSPLIPSQVYQLSMWILNTPLYNATTTPMVISVTSNSVFAFTGTQLYPINLNVITEFTVPPSPVWALYTNTFVFTPNINHNTLLIGTDIQKTMNYGFYTSSTNGNLYCFIDNVSLVSLPTPTFSIPNGSSCGNTTFTNLAQYTSPIPGVFTGTGITSVTTGSNTQYNFNSSGTLTAGNYPIGFTYTSTSGCVNTLWQNIAVTPSISVSVTGSTIICNNQTTGVPITATSTCNSCANVNYIWQPGFLVGTSQVVTPTVTTTYTASVYTGSCISSQTLAITARTNCCTQSVTAYASPSIVITTTMSNATAFNNDLTVTSGGWLTLTGSEFLFASNVKIIVKSGAILSINGAHLYGCTADLWKGIVVESGGTVRVQVPYLTYDNLIEDALTAIDITGPLSSGTSLDINRTTFNKNYIDINISNYTLTASPYPFTVENCVFTCRNLPFTSTAWPQTGTSSSASTTAGQLRTEITSTTGLSSPYISPGYTVTTLKAPYSGKKSHIAIQLDNMGATNSTGMYGVTIGNATNTAAFNLFDTHDVFIFANNSNVSSQNNVFQNTTGNSYGAVQNGNVITKIPGAAIIDFQTGVLNAKLDLNSSSYNTGNRFWNCHRSVMSTNVYSVNIHNAIFRSTQSSLNGSAVLPGCSGLNLSTNRFAYHIYENEFTNINSPINISIGPGTYTSYATGYQQNGIYADRIRVYQNSISAGSTSTTNFVNNAIAINGPGSVAWFVPTYSVSPFQQGVIVTTNTITDVYRGISIGGVMGLQTEIANNIITLKDDNYINSGGAQYGINLENTNPTTGATIGKNIISYNTVSFASPSSSTNVHGTLIYCGTNGYGLCSPSITCNSLTKAYQAFDFDNSNSGTLWAGNTMTLPIARGLVLTNAGMIAAQGGSTYASMNGWFPGGSWTSSTTVHTYVDGTSDAQFSRLYVKAGSATTPTNNAGPISAQSYVQTGYINQISGSEYNCYGMPNGRVVSIPNEHDFSSLDQFYMAEIALYQFLHKNDSLRTYDATLGDFYINLSGSTIAKFTEIEEKIYGGYRTEASTLNSELDENYLGTVETNYKHFYSLYLTYADSLFNPTTAADSSALMDLCNLCPGTNGACVYQARALYNLVYKVVLNLNSCSGGGDRLAYNSSFNTKKSGKTWDIDLFPNPATDQIKLISKTDTEILTVEIKDLSNRIIQTLYLKTNAFFATLDLALVNGVYFITISNQHNERTTKKLLIAK